MTTNTLIPRTGSATPKTLEQSRAELYANYAKDRDSGLQKQKEKDAKKRNEYLRRHEYLLSGQKLGTGSPSAIQTGRVQQRRTHEQETSPLNDPALLAARSQQQLSYSRLAEQQVLAKANKPAESEREKAIGQNQLQNTIITGRRVGSSS